MEEIRFEFEVRESESSPGQIVGTILTYGERARDRAELFEPGALTWPDEGIVLNRQHRRDAPIMRIVPEVRGSAIVVDAPLPDTTAGRDAATEIRAKLFRGLSVEFRAIRQSYVDGIRRIQEAALGAVGLVDSPSYPNSLAEVHRSRRVRLWL